MKCRSRVLQAILVLFLGVGLWAQDSPPPANDTQNDYPQAADTQGYPQADAQPSYPSDNPSASDSNTPDPPGRVARLQYTTGQVSVQPQGTGDWVEGSRNRPLTDADNIWADKDSRAELNVGNGALRIGSESSLTLTNIDNNAVQVALHQGALNVHVRHLYSGEVWEIDTPNLAFTVKKPGDYRFDVDPDGDTTKVTVRKGAGEATGQGSPVEIRDGEEVSFSGGNSLQHVAANAPAPDSFDQWCALRDRHDDQSAASDRYVNPDVVGSQDLNEYGSWKDSSDYGPVWVPNSVAPGWAPYSYGNWVWVSPWGWTWVDDAAWGFAPFHYGRWVYGGWGWGWTPGPYWYRPWYAPALVGWYGGSGWGFGFGFGWGYGPRYGWCPLGFREPYHPWFHTSVGYFRNVNLSNARISNFNRVSNNYFSGRAGTIPSHFENAGKPGALNAMSQNGLQRGLAVHGNSVHLTPNELQGAHSLSRPNINPTHQTMLGARSRPGARPMAGSFSRPTVSRMRPPAASQRGTGNQTVGHGANSFGRNAGFHGSPNSIRSSEARNGSMPGPAGRTVPRPPQSFANLSHGATGNTRGETSEMAMNHYVPRPPGSSMRSYSSPDRNTGRTATGARSVPHPSMGTETGHSVMSARNEGSAFSHNVPRPTGRILPAPRSYSNPERGYSGRSYGQSYSARSYGGYSSRSYGSPYGGSYGARSYGSPYGGSYGARSYGNSYGGRGGYSAPSRGFSGSGGYHGGGGFSGGGHMGGMGGGGHMSAGGGHGGGGHR